ncbi:MAG: hypothetical protein IJY12_05625 [Clostridia bacterium]|nr:hypothetical protein [Clostridia bacterium]
MNMNAITAAAIGAAVGSVATVMLSGKKINGKKITREMKTVASGLSSMMPGMNQKKH